MRRPAVTTFIPYKRRSETRRAIFASSQSIQTSEQLPVITDPQISLPGIALRVERLENVRPAFPRGRRRSTIQTHDSRQAQAAKR
jgi:hypothetical protein